MTTLAPRSGLDRTRWPDEVRALAPGARLPLRVAAASVAYSRVHTGVHYPSDVAIGAVIGDLCGWAVGRLVARVAWKRR
jgi:membrane-associated phospholipid phosphatase